MLWDGQTFVMRVVGVAPATQHVLSKVSHPQVSSEGPRVIEMHAASVQRSDDGPASLFSKVRCYQPWLVDHPDSVEIPSSV